MTDSTNTDIDNATTNTDAPAADKTQALAQAQNQADAVVMPTDTPDELAEPATEAVGSTDTTGEVVTEVPEPETDATTNEDMSVSADANLATTDVVDDAAALTAINAEIEEGVETPTPNTDDQQAPAPSRAPTFFEASFAGVTDHGDTGRYFYLSFSALQQDGNRAFGATPVYSNGMFSIDSIRQDLMRNNNFLDVAISNWNEIPSLEEFNAMFGDVPVEDTGAGVSYYHVHYVLTDGEGRQVIGSTPAQTAGILNIPALRRFLAETYATNENYVVITNWLPIDTVEDFAKLNGFIINEPTPQQ